MNSKTKTIIGWILTSMVAFVLVASGLFKLFGERTAEMTSSIGGENNLIILGVIELLIAALWFIPRTGVVAALLSMAYIGGAMAVHLTGGKPIMIPLIIQIIIWIAAVVRFPELGQRLFNKN